MSAANSEDRTTTDDRFDNQLRPSPIEDTLTEASGGTSRAASPPPRSESSRASSCPASVDDGLLEHDMKNDDDDRSFSLPEKRTRTQNEEDKPAPKRIKTKKAGADLYTFFGVKSKPDGKADLEDDMEDGEGDGNRRPNWSKYDNDRDSRIGHSRSAVAERKQRAAISAGTFEVNDAYFSKFRDQILAVDRHAKFKPTQKLVQHSKCGKWKTMKSAYSPLVFFKHAETCKGSQYGAITKFISTTECSDENGDDHRPERGYEERACKGLTADVDNRITQYISRPGALGGGGRSVVFLAFHRFGKTYSALPEEQKKEIRQMNEAGWRWILKPEYESIHSKNCLNIISVPVSHVLQDRWKLTCRNCWAIKGDKDFIRALTVPEPLDENGKYTNKVYKQEALLEKLDKCRGLKKLLQSTVSIVFGLQRLLINVCSQNDTAQLFLKYARGIANGDYQDNLVFTGLVYNIIKKRDREARGKKMTNFKHDPVFDEFVQTVAILSPRAHRLLAEFFVVRTARSIS